MAVSTKRKDLEDICYEFYGSLHKGQQSSKEAMAEVLDGLPISFIDAMNDELVKPFTTLNFESKQGNGRWLEQGTRKHFGI